VKFQPYFIAYAKAHGRTPEQQLEADGRRWPGGIMCGFICWIAERKNQFRELHPECFCGDNISRHAAWAKFLTGGTP